MPFLPSPFFPVATADPMTSLLPLNWMTFHASLGLYGKSGSPAHFTHKRQVAWKSQVLGLSLRLYSVLMSFLYISFQNPKYKAKRSVSFPLTTYLTPTHPLHSGLRCREESGHNLPGFSISVLYIISRISPAGRLRHQGSHFLHMCSSN